MEVPWSKTIVVLCALFVSVVVVIVAKLSGYLCDPMTRTTTDGHLGDGIVLLAVDNLPCELPNDASSFFSNQLTPLVPNLLKADYDRTLETSGLRPEIQKAVIVYNGKLTKDYEYLNVHLKQGI